MARYRRDTTFSGRPSYGNVYSAVNAMAGHLNSFGPTAPVPKKRLERMIKVGGAPGSGRQQLSVNGNTVALLQCASCRSIYERTKNVQPRKISTPLPPSPADCRALRLSPTPALMPHLPDAPLRSRPCRSWTMLSAS